MQYGFPQSECVSLHFGYSQESNSFTVDDVSVCTACWRNWYKCEFL